MDSSKIAEKFLQAYRFRVVEAHLHGDVLDFGGNKGELENYVHNGSYTVANYDHSTIAGKNFDTIVVLAVIEHIHVEEVHEIFKKFRGILRDSGKIVITSPTKLAQPVLEGLALCNIIDKKNIQEHKHYWDKAELYALAAQSNFKVREYRKFQFGFNQFAIFQHE